MGNNKHIACKIKAFGEIEDFENKCGVKCINYLNINDDDISYLIFLNDASTLFPSHDHFLYNQFNNEAFEHLGKKDFIKEVIIRKSIKKLTE